VRHEAGLTVSPVCEYCVSGRACDHGAEKTQPSPCACSLAGPKKCPECGCECAPWDWGLGFVGPASVRSFFGVGNDENPGFSQYPASKSQLVAAARQEFEESETEATDIEWLSRNLPEGMYPDRGAALEALSPVVAWRGDDPAVLVTALPMSAIAVGTRMVVGRDQSASLVAKDGRALDRFGPGEYVISRESAPRAAAQSRPAAAGFSKSVITATPFFASTRETRTAVGRTARTRSGEGFQVRGSVTFSIASLPDFLARLGRRPRGLSVAETEAVVAGIVGPALDQTLASHDAGELAGSSRRIEEAIRSAAAQGGLRVSAVTLDSIGPVSLSDQMATFQQMQRQAIAHLPPEAQARVQAQMAKAMERAQASGASRPGVPAAGTGPRTTTSTPPSSTAGQSCPSCHASNPPDVRFCGNCGQPLLPAKRSCPRCGKEAAPGVKFCGSCGNPLG
jgi:membrane protease subunit (stomatin/prohibitin family)